MIAIIIVLIVIIIVIMMIILIIIIIIIIIIILIIIIIIITAQTVDDDLSVSPVDKNVHHWQFSLGSLDTTPSPVFDERYVLGMVLSNLLYNVNRYESPHWS